MPNPRTLVLLATYNEIENLPGLVDEIRRVLPNADVLVIDDNSPDGTGRWCDERAAAEPRLYCLHRPGKQGLGSATLAGMQWALERDYELVITMDADWSHDPRHLVELVRAADSADVVIGSRYCPGGAIEGWPIRRRAMSRVMNALTRFALRLPIGDTSGAFRAYRTSALRKLDLSRIHATGYSYLEEILWHLHQVGADFAEVPITFHERRAGKSKISVGEATDKLATLYRLSCAKHTRPGNNHGDT
jgi:dolichol-phosphate mannosyltransferase